MSAKRTARARGVLLKTKEKTAAALGPPARQQRSFRGLAAPEVAVEDRPHEQDHERLQLREGREQDRCAGEIRLAMSTPVSTNTNRKGEYSTSPRKVLN